MPLASILCALAPTLWLLVAARALQGLGASVMMALTMAFVGSTVPKARTGSAMGLLGTMSAVGTTLGPALGGLLIARFGWQAIFLVNVPLAGVALLLAWRYLPADQRGAHAKRPVFDHRGTLLLALTLAAYALAMTLGRGHFGMRNVALLLAACVGAILFVRVELKAPAPLIRLAMLRAPVLSAGLATSMLVSTVMMSTLVVGPFYLARGLGLGTAATGMVLAAGPLVAAFCGVPSGWLVDRYGAQRMGGAGLCGAAGACLALALLPASLGIPGYVAPDHAADGQLRAVPGGQQYGRDGRYRSRAARRHLRHAQSVAQSGARHGRLRDGRRLRCRRQRYRQRQASRHDRAACTPPLAWPAR